MEFKKILKLAAEKQQKIEKEHSTIVKNSFSTKLAPPKKEVKVAKGINSSSVRAFLEESEKKNDSEKSARKQDRPNGAPTSTSVLSPEDTSKDIDLCHLFTKHDRRVAHASDKVIPNMLSLLKEKEKAKREKEEAERKATRERENQALQEREREKEAEREAKLRQKIGIESKSSGSHHHHHHHSLKRPHSKSPTGHRKDSSGGAPKFKIPKKSQAPVLNFEELMKIAEQKAKEPQAVVLNKVVEAPVAKPPPSKEPQRLMTQEEKDRLERRNSKAYQEWLKLGGMPPKTSSERQSSSTTAVDSKKVEGDRNKIKKIDDRGGSKHERHASSSTQEVQKSSVQRTSDGRPVPSSSKSVSSNHQRHASDGRLIRDESSSNKSVSNNHQRHASDGRLIRDESSSNKSASNNLQRHASDGRLIRDESSSNKSVSNNHTRHASDGRLIRDESSSNKTTSSIHQRNYADGRQTREEHSSYKSTSSSHHRLASDGRREESSSSGHHRHTSNGNDVRDKHAPVNRSEEKLARKDPERGASSSKENHNKPSREILRKCESDISNLKSQRSSNSGKTLDGGSRRDEVASRSRDNGRSRSPKNNGSQRSVDKSTADSTAEMFLTFLEQYEKLKNTGARKEEIIEKFKQLTKGSKSEQIDIFNKSSSNDVPLKAKSSQPEANRMKSLSSTSLKSTGRQADEKRIPDSKSAQGSNRDQSIKSVQNSKPVQSSKSATSTSKPIQNSKPVQTTKPIKSSEPVGTKPAPSSSSVNDKTESGKYVTPWDRIYDEMKKNNKPRQEKKRPAFEDSDEDEEDEEDYDDYDDDLDDFIDDGPVEEDRGFNYSKHIRDIFGYDKRRFIDDDDDDPNMESSFAQVQKEEIRSAKLGKLEDLEDMRMEEEENKRKMLMKKGKKLKK